MEEESIFVQCLGTSPVIRMIDYMLDNRLLDFSKKDVMDGSGVSKGTLFKNWERFERFEILRQTRKFGKTKLYKLNEENPMVKVLIAMDWALISKSLQELEDHVKIPVTIRA